MPSKGQAHIPLSPTEASTYANEIKQGNYIDVFLNEARHYLDRDDGRQRDLNKAYDFFKAAAELGSEAAWYYLALFHRAGIGKLPDDNEFFSCLERARQLEQSRLRSKRDTLTSQQSGPLHNALGVAYMEGAGCPRNLRRASRYFKTAVLANDGQALNNLSLTVLEAVEEVRDKVEVLIDVLQIVREVTPAVHRATTYDDDEWSQSDDYTGNGRHGEFGCSTVNASAGMPANAIEKLGEIHILCDTLGEAAVRSMRSRAEFGDYLRGMYNVAVACERGLAGPATPEDVMKTYRIVARSPGYGPAQVALAKYIFRTMIKKSDSLSEEDLTSMHCDGFRYLHRAAEANHPEAQAIYAAIYREGAFNVDPSPAEAETCLRLALENGWRGDGSETVHSLLASPSDYERFMQELVPESRQVLSRRTTYRRRMNTPHSQGSASTSRAPTSTALLSRHSTNGGSQRNAGMASLQRYHHTSGGGRKTRAGSDLRLMAVLKEESLNPGNENSEIHDATGLSSRLPPGNDIPSLLALADPAAERSSKYAPSTNARRKELLGSGGNTVHVLVEEPWMRAPLTGASTTASSYTEAHGNSKNPPRDSTSASQHAIPSGMPGGPPSASTKAYTRPPPSIATRPRSEYDTATEQPPTNSLTEMVSMRLPSCDLGPPLSAGVPRTTIQTTEAGDTLGDDREGGAYRFSRRGRHGPPSSIPTPSKSAEQSFSMSHDNSLQGQFVPTNSAQAKKQTSVSSDNAVDNSMASKVIIPKFHTLFPAPPDATLTTMTGGGSVSRSYHATWEDDAFEEGSDKSRPGSLPGTLAENDEGDIDTKSERIVPHKQPTALRLSDLKSCIAFGPKPTCSAWLRRLQAFTLHETALHLLLTQAPFPDVLDMLSTSYCLQPHVYRREPPDLSLRLTNTLQKLLEASVDTLNTLQPVVVFLYRFLLYDKGGWASGAAIVGSVPSSDGKNALRRFSDAAPKSPTFPPLVSRCLETLNRYIDLMEISEKSINADSHALSSLDISSITSASGCALWNLYLLRAMLKTRVLNYLDAADLNKAIDGCPSDRTHEVYYTYLTLVRECIGSGPVSRDGGPTLAISGKSNRDERTLDMYIDLLNKYLESAPAEDLAQFSHFFSFFAYWVPSPADVRSIRSLKERWTAKTGDTDYSLQFQSPWQLEANSHKNESHCEKNQEADGLVILDKASDETASRQRKNN